MAKWVKPAGEGGIVEGELLRTAHEGRRLTLAAPRLLLLEIVNAAGRRWLLSESDLLALCRLLLAFELELQEPPLNCVAAWTARGLSAYDATYAALAERLGTRVITEDQRLLSVGGPIAMALSSVRAEVLRSDK